MTRSTSTCRQTNRTPDGDTVQQQQRQHVIVACFADGNEGDSGVVTSPQLPLGGNIDADDVLGTSSCSTQLCETSCGGINCGHMTTATGVCISALGKTNVAGDNRCDMTTCSIDQNILTATPCQPCEPCRSGMTDDNQILRSPTVETQTVSVSRYPHLKARLPTPLLPFVVDARSSALQYPPHVGDLSMTAGSPSTAVYRYSVDPPSPVGYADDSPDREVTPISLGNDDVERGHVGRFTVWNDVDASIASDNMIVDRPFPSSADNDDRRFYHLDERNADTDEVTRIQQEVIQSNSVKSGIVT